MGLDKRAYNDARYGVGGLLGHSGASGLKERTGLGRQRSSFRSGAFRLQAPTIAVIVLSMVYGGYVVAMTHADCGEVAQQAFKLAFADITQSWEEIVSAIGLSGGPSLPLIVEFIAVAAALIFALFAGAGGLIVYAFLMLSHG